MTVTVVLVEGESDKAALLALARRQRPGLEGISVVSMGGATNAMRFVAATVETGDRPCGLYDINEEVHLTNALVAAQLAPSPDRQSLERQGFFACDPDLEAELIKAAGADRIVEIIGQQGDDLRRFRALQQMPEWRGRPVEDQLRRWFGSGSGRKIRYARLIVDELVDPEVPRPLQSVIEFALAD